MYIYQDFYYPNLTSQQDEYLQSHMDHCLEALREEIMCYGDTAIMTFFWHDPPQPKPGVKSNARKSCINWDQLQQWSSQHMVPLNAAVRGGPSPIMTKEQIELQATWSL